VTALLLAGTAEARALSHLAARAGLPLVTSLAGVTRKPAEYGGRLRSGGFGGAAGLAEWLRAEGVAAVVDATHPFAARMSGNAVAACAEAGVPLLRLERPSWTRDVRAATTLFDSEQAALAALPGGALALAALGRSGGALAPPPPGVRLVLRAIEDPGPLPGEVTLIRGRAPDDPAEERALFLRLGLTHLVCRDSGGAAGRAKLDAAADLGLAVHMIARPPLPRAECVETEAAALDWLAARVAKRTGSAAPRA